MHNVPAFITKVGPETWICALKFMFKIISSQLTFPTLWKQEVVSSFSIKATVPALAITGLFISSILFAKY
jgi:hypothetical protein